MSTPPAGGSGAGGSFGEGTPGRNDVRLFWAVIVVVLALDVVTKRIAERALQPRGIPHEVWGDVLRLTLVYNPGAAFGLHLGTYSRWIFTALTLGALVILWRLFRTTRAGDRARTLALALVCGGAVGNLLDRLRAAQGVVDFIDVGIGEQHRWPTFNVADMAVSVGAFLLAWVLWGEDEAAEQQNALGPRSSAVGHQATAGEGADDRTPSIDAVVETAEGRGPRAEGVPSDPA